MKVSKTKITASTQAEMQFWCPVCHNQAVTDVDTEVHQLLDMDYHDHCVCNECGSEFLGEVTHDLKPKFTRVTESVMNSLQSEGGISHELRSQIYEFLDDCGGYTDYNQKIEDVVDEFGLSPDTAEGVVWDWSLNNNAEWHDTADMEDEEPDYDEDVVEDEDLYAATNTCGMMAKPEIIEEDEQVNTSITAARRISMKDLHDDIQSAAIQWFKTSYGDPDLSLNDIADMLVVDTNDADDGRTIVEVRAELSYDGMWELAELLNPIVAKYDREAYFDMEQPGIMTAYLDPDGIYASTVIDLPRTLVTANLSSKNTVNATREFNDWLLGKYGWTSDDMTDADYDRYWEEYLDYRHEEGASCAVTAANYGGAYDIDPDAYFTRDDLTEFGESVAELISLDAGQNAEYQGAWIDNNQLTASFMLDDFEYEVNVKIDMRRIRRPNDLLTKYGDAVATKFIEEYQQYMADMVPEEIESSVDVEAGQKLVMLGTYLDPPEYEEPYDLSDDELFQPYEIDLTIDDIIEVYPSQYWDWADDVHDWATPQIENYAGVQNAAVDSDTYWLIVGDNRINIVDSGSIISHVEALLDDSGRIPEYPGLYRVKGRAILSFEFSETFGFRDGDGFIDDVYVEDVEVKWDRKASEFIKLQIEQQ